MRYVALLLALIITTNIVAEKEKFFSAPVYEFHTEYELKKETVKSNMRLFRHSRFALANITDNITLYISKENFIRDKYIPTSGYRLNDPQEREITISIRFKVEW